MFTANDAKNVHACDLDERIERAVREGGFGRASLRVYIEDPWVYSIQEELEKRGFKNVDVPDICIKGDVHFEWDV